MLHVNSHSDGVTKRSLSIIVSYIWFFNCCNGSFINNDTACSHCTSTYNLTAKITIVNNICRYVVATVLFKLSKCVILIHKSIARNAITLKYKNI